MSDLTGNNRIDPPGLSPYRQLDPSSARQVISHLVESTAVHSRSQGFLPGIFVTLEHTALVGPPGVPQRLTFVMLVEDAATFIEVLSEGLERAIGDAKYGYREGQ
jgi:molybdopterin-biosynthesis enzyme MoeA-like protein